MGLLSTVSEAWINTKCRLKTFARQRKARQRDCNCPGNRKRPKFLMRRRKRSSAEDKCTCTHICDPGLHASLEAPVTATFGSQLDAPILSAPLEKVKKKKPQAKTHATLKTSSKGVIESKPIPAPPGSKPVVCRMSFCLVRDPDSS